MVASGGRRPCQTRNTAPRRGSQPDPNAAALRRTEPWEKETEQEAAVLLVRGLTRTFSRYFRGGGTGRTGSRKCAVQLTQTSGVKHMSESSLYRIEQCWNKVFLQLPFCCCWGLCYNDGVPIIRNLTGGSETGVNMSTRLIGWLRV